MPKALAGINMRRVEAGLACRKWLFFGVKWGHFQVSGSKIEINPHKLLVFGG